MKMTVLVIQERPEEYTGKRGLVKQTILAVVDMEPETRDRLATTLDYVLSEEEQGQFAGGKLIEKQIQIAVTGLEVKFGGRLRARGRIIPAQGA
ncbi:MAG: hypothetical protein ACOYMV_12535 [Verrucomicrobiia bacterium]